MKEIKLYKSPVQGFFLFLGGFIFVIGGIFIIVKSEDKALLGWLCTIFFGLCSLVGLVILFDKKPQIIITKKGIGYRKAIWKKYNPDDSIEWNTLKRVYARSVENNKFLCLVPAEKVEKKRNLMQKLNKNMGFQDININLGLIKIDEHKLADFANSMIHSDDTKREQLIENFTVPLPKNFFSRFNS